MAQPFPIISKVAGMAQDYSRDDLPGGFVWNMQDYIPDILGAPLRKRGGWVNASSTLGTNTSVARVGWTQSTSAGLAGLYAIDSATATSSGPFLWSINTSTGVGTSAMGLTSTSATSAVGTADITNMVYYAGYLNVGVRRQGGALYRYTSDGASFSTVSSGGCYLAVYKDRLVSAYDPTAKKRVYFSAAGNPTAISTSAYIDATNEITGMTALANVLLLFSVGQTERIRGSTPPPGTDMVLEKVSDYGCVDFRSIAVWQNKAIYADTNGVYLTDGASTVDLVKAGGLSNFYRTLLSSWSSSWRLTGGVFRNYYFLSVANGPGGTFQDCLVCDLTKRTWFRFQNFNFRGFTESVGSFQDFYAACATQGRVAKVTSVFSPTASNKADGDGTSVLPIIELPCERGFLHVRRRWMQTGGLTHWKRLYLRYLLSDAGSDNPTLQFAYVKTPDSTSYTTLADTLSENTTMTRGAFDFGPSGARGGLTALALGLKVTQTAASADTRLYGLEAEYETIEGSRL